MRKKETGFFDSLGKPIRTGDFLARNYWTKEEPKFEVFHVTRQFGELVTWWADGAMGEPGEDPRYDDFRHEAWLDNGVYVIPNRTHWRNHDNWHELPAFVEKLKKEGQK